MGLSETLDLETPSPFDYRQQATLYVPRYLPEPNAPEFAPHSREAIRQILESTQGRAFVLFTSYKAMHAAFTQLWPQLPYPTKKQGDLPRAQLIDWFKATPHAVLFATSSFWEGVDVPGEALSCVIIDRLPFSVPDDPVVQAHVERLKMQGKDWFREYTLPEAIIRLKQGFGRLIRTSTDRGLVAILDNRLFTKNYGAAILRALPDCPTVRDLRTSNCDGSPRLGEPRSCGPQQYCAHAHGRPPARWVTERLATLGATSVLSLFNGNGTEAREFRRLGMQVTTVNPLISSAWFCRAFVEGAEPARERTVSDWVRLRKDPDVVKRFFPWANRVFTPEETIWLGIWHEASSRARPRPARRPSAWLRSSG